MYYAVRYSGPFGFIKPWTAVRDSETFSLQFLITSTIEGIEKKLFPELLHTTERVQKISRYRLNYCGLDSQQERTWSKTSVSLPGAFCSIHIYILPLIIPKTHYAQQNNPSACAEMKTFYYRIALRK